MHNSINHTTFGLGSDMMLSVKITNITWEEKVIDFDNPEGKIVTPVGGTRKLEFSVKSVMTGKKETEKKGLMYYVEEYLNLQTPEFREALFKEYQVASDTIDRLALSSSVEPLDTSIFYRILDMINLDDLKAYLTRAVVIPKELKDEFVQDNNGMLNEVQTYTKKEYLDLILMSTFIRFTLPVLGKYIQVKAPLMHEHFKEYTFAKIYQHYDRISKSEAYKKLYAFCAKAYSRDRNSENDSVRSIIYGIPKDETVKWLFSAALILVVASLSTVNDSGDKNIITKIFNSILKSRIQKDTTRTMIKDKDATLSTKGTEETQESKSESIRITASLMPGHVEELNWSADSVAFIEKQMSTKNIIIDLELGERIFAMLNSYSKGERFIVPKSTFVLLGWIFHGKLLHMDAIKYLGKQYLFSVICAAYSHLWVNGFKDLALTLVSKCPPEEDGTFNNNATNRTKLTEIVRNELDAFYSIKKNKLTRLETQELSVAELGINALSDIMFQESYITIAPIEHILEVKESSSPVIVMESDLKLRLAKLLIFINNR